MANEDHDEYECEPEHFCYGLPTFKFEEFLNNALEKITNISPEITKDLRRVLKNGSTSDIFEALWNLDEAHQHLVLPERLISVDVESRKSVGQSLLYLDLGYSHRLTDRDAALLHYNRSIIHAPHPPIYIDNNVYAARPQDIDEDDGGGHSEGWGAYGPLARGYMARAELLLAMRQYTACIEDTSMVQLLGCPSEVHEQLMHIRTHCYNMMTGRESARVERFASFAFTCAELPVLEDRNPYLPAASSAVSLAYDDGLKRHLKTNRNVKQGEVLIVEENYCSALLPKYIRLYCAVCMRRTWTPLPCCSCTQVVFCSPACRIQALLGVHGQECPILLRLNNLNMDVRGILACRILLKATFNKLRDKYVDIVCENKKSLQHRGLTQDGALLSDEYLSVFSMVGKQKHTAVDKLSRAAEAFILLKLLMASNSFFVDGQRRRVEPSWEDQLFTGSLLMHHLTNLWRTADVFFETEVMDTDCTKNPMKAFGAGVFPVTNLAMVPASYAPCASFTHGGHLVMRATCAMSAGTILRCKYTHHMWNLLPRKEDEVFAQDVFGSSRDEGQDDVGDLALERVFLKCVRCPGRVQFKCLDCDLDYNNIGPVPGMPHLNTYDYKEVMAMVNYLVRRYQHTRKEIRRKRLHLMSDVDIIRELIAYFDKYVHLPTAVHRDAQLMYIIVVNHMSFAVVYDGKNGPGCSIS